MGCCFSTGSNQADYVKPLISDPSLDPTNGSEQNTDSLLSNHTDEQALLAILQQTALSIIDVSAVVSQGLEQREYMDRARQYSTKLEVLNKTLSQNKPDLFPSLTSQPHQVSKIAAYAYSAISQIKVDAKDELVVQFVIP
ncbi:ragulator complex protein LAMTOR1-like isoform X2 [Labeo rohita]|uniref:ragulator complex protein LAMTOR1-like isoform X2 n=1 Tax=Labeo rohita TaxID=84645 RepID=UPI0021E28689|nr:ragulator complex protein LAMTOR1-like isoform X2 [Labeo rohita]